MSVAVICYCHGKFVAAALDSIAAQTFTDFELIIIDDASGDGTVARVEGWLEETGFSARLIIHQSNVGLPNGLNEAIGLASGELFCSISGDDLMAPERLERQVACFDRSGPEVGVVYSDSWLANEDGEITGTYHGAGHAGRERGQGSAHAEMLRQNFVPAPSALIRRSCFDVVGLYDPSLSIEDFDMWLRLSASFEFALEPGCLVTHRQHPAALSVQLGLGFKEVRLHILRLELERTDSDSDLVLEGIAKLARDLYRRGDTAPIVAESLTLLARHRRHPSDRFWGLLKSARIPGPPRSKLHRILQRLRSRLKPG